MSASRTFRALRHRNYKLWFFGQGLSLIGTWMQTMAQQVLVYRLSHSASALGIVNFVGVIPLIPFALWGGSISDRFSKRKVILSTQILMMAQALVLAFLTWSGIIQIWHVYLMSFMLGMLKAIDTPARQSYVVEMVEGKEDISSAVGLNSAINNGAKTLGPALAGVAVAAMGESTAFFLNGLSFLAVIVSLMMMTERPSSSEIRRLKGSSLDYTLGGIRYIVRHPLVAILVSLVAVSSFLSKPYQTLLPVFADSVLGESAKPIVDALCASRGGVFECKAPEALPLGLLFSSVGVGAVIGAVSVASLPEKAKKGRLLTLGNLCAPLFVLLFVTMNSLGGAMLMVFFVGMTNVFQKSMVNTLLLISVPDDIRGRVMSVYSLVSQGMTRIGGLQAGFSADLIGAPSAVGIGAAICLLYGTFVAVRYPQIRKLV